MTIFAGEGRLLPVSCRIPPMATDSAAMVDGRRVTSVHSMVDAMVAASVVAHYLTCRSSHSTQNGAGEHAEVAIRTSVEGEASYSVVHY